jgi:hypothetical protein
VFSFVQGLTFLGSQVHEVSPPSSA